MNLRQSQENLFDNSRMSFGEHLEELRKVLIKSLIGIAIGCVFGFLLASSVINVLTGPLVKAMTKYAQVNAMDDLARRKGFVDPELVPWIEQENLIPRENYVDPVSLIAALQTVLPDFAQQVTVDPYRFDASQFPADKLAELSRALVDQSLTTDPDLEGLQARRKKLWTLLEVSEQEALRGLKDRSDFTVEDSETVAEIFNRLSKMTQLFELNEFSADLAEPESSGLAGLFFRPPANFLAEMYTKYQSDPNPTLARQLNRALLSKLFANQMTDLRLNLVPIELWERPDFQPQSLGVSETFLVWMKAGLMTGVTFAAPYVFYQMWTFVAAGLYPHEQKYVHMYLPISIALFVVGVLLAFLFVFEPVLDFLFSFNRQMGISPQMRINDWLSFVMFLPLGFGTAFQLPLVMLFLNRIGLIQVADYIGKWRIAIMVIFVISMFLTPADPVSMLFLAVPLTFLYFLGIGLCKWMPKNKNPFGEEEREYTPV